MRLFGLIGFPLTHSFSKKYFTEKFEKEGINDAKYELFELSKITQLKDVLSTNAPHLKGLNVTIPYKELVIPYLDALDPAAEEIGAVNVIKVLDDGRLVGYNSDYYGFRMSLENMLGAAVGDIKALVLGTGGASKAVKKALIDLGIPSIVVSRNRGKGIISYEDVHDALLKSHQLIINTSPVGMYPNIEQCPAIQYDQISEGFFLYDLVYNPLETQFMKLGKQRGAIVQNGLDMLHLQAEKAWDIWNS